MHACILFLKTQKEKKTYHTLRNGITVSMTFQNIAVTLYIKYNYNKSCHTRFAKPLYNGFVLRDFDK